MPTPPDTAHRPAVRCFHAALAWLCTALALAGVVLPGLPTTPFLIVAAWAARRGCPGLDRWLRTHRHLGPLLDHWETQRAISPRAKCLALALLAASWVVIAQQAGDFRIALAAAVPMGAVALFIATRPAPRPVTVEE